MVSEAETEIVALYVNDRKYVSPITVLIELWHQQPRTPMQTYNLATHSVLMNNIQTRIGKAMDMIFHFLRCRDAQGHFKY